ELRARVEPIARLRLDRGRAVRQHLAEPPPAVGKESGLVRSARRRDGREDPTTGGQDLEVAGPLLAKKQLLFAAAAKEEMGMRVDEARRDRPATGVERRESIERQAVPGEDPVDGLARSDSDDPALPDRDDGGMGIVDA